MVNLNLASNNLIPRGNELPGHRRSSRDDDAFGGLRATSWWLQATRLGWPSNSGQCILLQDVCQSWKLFTGEDISPLITTGPSRAFKRLDIFHQRGLTS